MPNYSRKITVYTGTTAPNGSGGNTIAWDGGTVKWADIEITQNGKLFAQGQEYNGTYYTIQLNAMSLRYTPPVENYKIEVDAFGVTRTLKIVSAEQPDLLSYNLIIKAIESNG